MGCTKSKESFRGSGDDEIKNKIQNLMLICNSRKVSTDKDILRIEMTVRGILFDIVCICNEGRVVEQKSSLYSDLKDTLDDFSFAYPSIHSKLKLVSAKCLHDLKWATSKENTENLKQFSPTLSDFEEADRTLPYELEEQKPTLYERRKGNLIRLNPDVITETEYINYGFFDVSPSPASYGLFLASSNSSVSSDLSCV